MGYYVRAFCTATHVPSLREAIEWTKQRNVDLRVSPDSGTINLDISDWEKVHLLHKEGKHPLVVECNRDDGSSTCLAREEIQEFLDFLASAENSKTKLKLENHLKATRFIIAVQLLSDIDNDGYNANGEFLKFFVEKSGGIIQADGEGFYEGNELVLRIK